MIVVLLFCGLLLGPQEFFPLLIVQGVDDVLGSVQANVANAFALQQLLSDEEIITSKLIEAVQQQIFEVCTAHLKL